MQHIYFYIDDSGVFHKSEKSGKFVYGGFVFTNTREKDSAKRKYINANKKIKQTLGVADEEIKAYGLSKNHRRALYNSVRSFQSFSVCVKLNNVYDYILSDKKSICRFKDYALKRVIKEKLLEMMRLGKINSSVKTALTICIDEQLTASNGYYGLRETIYEEFRHGIENYNYARPHSPIFQDELNVDIYYCDSKKNYLIQASDILANKIWNSSNKEIKEISDNYHHFHLILP
jgi:hypothetical protein